MDFRTDPAYPKIISFLEQSRGLPPGLLNSVVGAESSGNQNSKSPAGALGLVQFMPANITKYNVNMNDPADQLRGGADMLQDLIHQYGGNTEAAVSHYNGGKYNARRYIDGTEPGPDKVSPANAAVNKDYTAKVMAGVQKQEPQQATEQAPNPVQQIRSAVVAMAKGGASSNDIITELLRNPATADIVSQGRQAGDSFEQIVKNIGGPEYAPIAAERERVAGQNIGQNFVQGAGNAFSDIGNAGKQLASRATGNDAELASLQQQQAQAEAAPGRQALGDTVGGWVGNAGVKALPYVAAGALTGGSAIPLIAGQAAAGALEGALTPTTGEGQIVSNILTDAAIGGGTAGVFKGAGAASKQIGGMVKDSMSGNTARSIMSPAARASTEAKGMVDAGKTLNAGIGQEATAPVAPETVAAARGSIYKEADALAGKVKVPSETGGITEPLRNIMDDYHRATPAPDVAPSVGKYANDLITKIKSGEMTGSDLINFRKSVANAAFEANGTTRQALNSINDVIDQHLQNIAPDVSTALKTANEQWRNLQVYEKVVEKAKGQPDGLTPKNIINSVIQTNRDAFQGGSAPYQELADALSKAYGSVEPSIPSQLANMLHKSGDLGVQGLIALSHPAGAALIAGKYGLSRLVDAIAKRAAPSVSDFLPKAAGDTAPAMNKYIAAALGGNAGAANPKPLLLGYTPSTIAVDGAGRASADPAAMFTAKYAPQAADAVPLVQPQNAAVAQLLRLTHQPQTLTADAAGNVSADVGALLRARAATEQAAFDAKYAPQDDTQQQLVNSILAVLNGKAPKPHK